MELVKPGIGLLFWMTLTFSIVLYILTKYAWKPIMKSIREREDSISNALNAAEEARRQMDALKSDNEKLLNEARAERDRMLKDAGDIRENIISQAKKSADEEFRKKVASASEEIEKQKLAAMNELKTQVASLAVDLAEKVLRSELSDRSKQESFINENLKSISLN